MTTPSRIQNSSYRDSQPPKNIERVEPPLCDALSVAMVTESLLLFSARFCFLRQFPRKTERGEPVRPFMPLIGLHFHRSFPHSFHATPDTRGAARHNLITVGVEDLKRNRIGELVPVVTDVDGPREPVCLYPGSGGAKDKGLGHCAIRVAIRVPPHAQTGSA